MKYEAQTLGDLTLAPQDRLIRCQFRLVGRRLPVLSGDGRGVYLAGCTGAADFSQVQGREEMRFQPNTNNLTGSIWLPPDTEEAFMFRLPWKRAFLVSPTGAPQFEIDLSDISAEDIADVELAMEQRINSALNLGPEDKPVRVYVVGDAVMVGNWEGELHR
jgi:hypothetical protein